MIDRYREEDGIFLNFHTDLAVNEKVNRKNHPYFAIHTEDIYRTEERQGFGRTVSNITDIVIVMLFCIPWQAAHIIDYIIHFS